MKTQANDASNQYMGTQRKGRHTEQNNVAMLDMREEVVYFQYSSMNDQFESVFDQHALQLT